MYEFSHAHKNTCMALKWNRHNGNWLISASRDHFCKLFDIRNLKEEVQCFRGHKKEACSKLFLLFLFKKKQIKIFLHRINVNKAEILSNIYIWNFIVLIYFILLK
jgi:WD40 repeat protein